MTSVPARTVEWKDELGAVIPATAWDLRPSSWGYQYAFAYYDGLGPSQAYGVTLLAPATHFILRANQRDDFFDGAASYRGDADGRMAGLRCEGGVIANAVRFAMSPAGSWIDFGGISPVQEAEKLTVEPILRILAPVELVAFVYVASIEAAEALLKTTDRQFKYLAPLREA